MERADEPEDGYREEEHECRGLNAEDASQVEPLERDLSAHALFFEKARADEDAADCEEQLHASIAEILNRRQGEKAEVDGVRVVKDDAADGNRSPAVERRDVAALSLQLAGRGDSLAEGALVVQFNRWFSHEISHAR